MLDSFIAKTEVIILILIVEPSMRVVLDLHNIRLELFKTLRNAPCKLIVVLTKTIVYGNFTCCAV